MATKRILIADDSVTIQKAFAMTFAGEDVTLLAARSADEGLTMARQARPELVIADAVMPGRSGYDLCASIKSDPSLRGVPVYILASSQNPYDDGRGRQSGADGHLIKPFDSLALVEKVNDAIARGTTISISAPSPSVVTPAPIRRASSPTAPATGRHPVVQSGLASPLDDDYGEISIEESGPQQPASGTSRGGSARAGGLASPAASEITPPPVVPLSPSRPSSSPAAGAGAGAAGGLRPSLIPGLRPGAAPAPGRPGTMPSRPAAAPGLTGSAGAGPIPVPLAHGPSTQLPLQPSHQPPPAFRAPYQPPAAAGPARTLVGLPATVALGQAPARFGAPAAPARPPTQPVRPLDGRTPTPASQQNPLFPPVGGAASAATVSSRIDQKVAAIAARGPEYEAIAKLSREIIERIVWEVVPELTEVIIREELQKRGRV